MEVKRYTLYLPVKSHQALKIHAAKNNTNITKIISELVEEFIKKEQLEYDRVEEKVDSNESSILERRSYTADHE